MLTSTRIFLFFKMIKLLSNKFPPLISLFHLETIIHQQNERKKQRYFDYFSMTVYLPFQEESVDLFYFSSSSPNVKITSHFISKKKKKTGDRNGILLHRHAIACVPNISTIKRDHNEILCRYTTVEKNVYCILCMHSV